MIATLHARALRIWHHVMHDSFRRNSTLLIIAQLINACSSFLFWIICARLFTAHTVGLATAFISFAALAGTFTTLGLPTTIIRFLPRSMHKSQLFGAALALVCAASLLGASVGVLAIKHIAPDLSFVQTSLTLTVLLFALIVANALTPLLDNTLMAFKKGEHILARYALTSALRVLLPFAFVSMAVSGIVSVYVIVMALSVLYGVIVVRRKLFMDMSLHPRFSEVMKHRGFAIRNYAGVLAGVLPSTLVPIIVLNALGPTKAAFFYMPMQFAAFLSVISSSVSQALVSESSQHDDAAMHKEELLHAVRHLFRLLVPAAFGVMVSGWLVLRLYGAQYASNGYVPLVILCLAALFVGVNWLGDTWLIITKRMNSYLIMNAINSLLVLGSVAAFAKLGLVAAATGWLVAQAITVVIYLSVFGRDALPGLARPKTSQ
jgi:O-antigen/teichoic acid export membrane protein